MESGEGGEEEKEKYGTGSSGLHRRFALFIDGISESTSYFRIRNLFEQYGKVCNLFIQRKKKPGRNFRFGFVRYAYREQAIDALKLDGSQINGEVISLSVAKAPGQNPVQSRANTAIVKSRNAQGRKGIETCMTFAEVVRGHTHTREGVQGIEDVVPEDMRMQNDPTLKGAEVFGNKSGIGSSGNRSEGGGFAGASTALRDFQNTVKESMILLHSFMDAVRETSCALVGLNDFLVRLPNAANGAGESSFDFPVSGVGVGGAVGCGVVAQAAAVAGVRSVSCAVGNQTQGFGVGSTCCSE